MDQTTNPGAARGRRAPSHPAAVLVLMCGMTALFGTLLTALTTWVVVATLRWTGVLP